MDGDARRVVKSKLQQALNTVNQMFRLGAEH